MRATSHDMIDQELKNLSSFLHFLVQFAKMFAKLFHFLVQILKISAKLFLHFFNLLNRRIWNSSSSTVYWNLRYFWIIV